MLGKTHIAGGMLASASVLILAQETFPALNSFSTGLAIGVGTIYFSSICSLLPDIDHKNSIAGRKLWFISWPLYFLQIIFKFLSLIGLFKKSRKIIDHRGFTHYPSTWLLTTLLCCAYNLILKQFNLEPFFYYLLLTPALGLSIGILSHIVLDFFSGKIKLLAPFNFKSYGFAIIKTGSFLEMIVRLLFYIATFKLTIMYINNIII